MKGESHPVLQTRQRQMSNRYSEGHFTCNVFKQSLLQMRWWCWFLRHGQRQVPLRFGPKPVRTPGTTHPEPLKHIQDKWLAPSGLLSFTRREEPLWLWQCGCFAIFQSPGSFICLLAREVVQTPWEAVCDSTAIEALSPLQCLSDWFLSHQGQCERLDDIPLADFCSWLVGKAPAKCMIYEMWYCPTVLLHIQFLTSCMYYIYIYLSKEV